jgi:fructokinase
MSYQAAAIGELLIDFTHAGKSENGMNLFEQNPGGAPANVICALAKLGMRTAFIGKVGNDMHGNFLYSLLNEIGVDTSGLILDDKVFTTLAFVSLSPTGERSFSFARKPGADTCLRAEELNADILEKCTVFHFGSVSLSDEPSRSATLEAACIAKDAGAIISFDPNYRPLLWKNEKEAALIIRSCLHLVDVIKISEEETKLLTDKARSDDAANELLRQGVGCAVVTCGAAGALGATKKGIISVGANQVNVVDTTGAGDAFWGGFLYKLIDSGVTPEQLNELQLRDFLSFANTAAALCIQKRGAIPALPSMDEIIDYM